MIAKVRDSQKSKVYHWEREHIFGEWALEPEMTLDECHELIRTVWQDYRGAHSNPPRLEDGRGSRRGRASMWRIALPKWARRRPIILHEVTHSLGGENWRHGPQFVRLYIELLCRYDRVVPRIDLLKSARATHVRVGSLAACPMPRP